MTVVNVEKTRTGFQIIAFIKEPFEEMYERLTFAGEFPYEDQAQRLAKKIRYKLADHYGALSALNLEHWLWTPSKSTPYAALQQEPTAKPWIVGPKGQPQ